jgi:hypothetical protein
MTLIDRLITIVCIAILAVMGYILYIRVVVPIDTGLNSILAVLGQ